MIVEEGEKEKCEKKEEKMFQGLLLKKLRFVKLFLSKET
jgi:hypothetical protein